MSFNAEIIAVVLVAGLLCGFLNAVASSGSAVSLPVLLTIGLHATVANATNRIPVLVGSLAATVGLARSGTIPWRPALIVA
ncbi:MAG TPA: TSUP family transporter, partial [Paraburkholderia sp.]